MKNKKLVGIVSFIVIFLLFALGSVAGIWYYREYNLKRDVAHWQTLVAGKPDGQKYMDEIYTQLEKLKDGDPSNDATAYTFVAASVNVLGDKEGALKYYGMALELDPTSRLALNNTAVICEDLGQWERAEGYYLDLIKAEPTYTPAYRQLAYLYQYRFNDDEQKIKALIDKGLAATNNDPDLLSWIISYYQEHDQGGKALPYSEILASKLNQAGQ